MRDSSLNEQYTLRLKKINGQITGIINMLENNNTCEAVLTQILAAQGALKKLGKIVIKDHMTHCVQEGIKNGEENALTEFYSLLEKFL